MDPAVLIISSDAERFEPLVLALEQRGVFVETAGADAIDAAVVAATPDLILIFAEDVAPGLVKGLAHAAPNMPVVMLCSAAAHELRLRAFPEGTAVAVPWSDDAKVTAQRVTELGQQVMSSGGKLPTSTSGEGPFAEARREARKRSIRSSRVSKPPPPPVRKRGKPPPPPVRSSAAPPSEPIPASEPSPGPAATSEPPAEPVAASEPPPAPAPASEPPPQPVPASEPPPPAPTPSSAPSEQPRAPWSAIRTRASGPPPPASLDWDTASAPVAEQREVPPASSPPPAEATADPGASSEAQLPSVDSQPPSALAGPEPEPSSVDAAASEPPPASEALPSSAPLSVSDLRKQQRGRIGRAGWLVAAGGLLVVVAGTVVILLAVGFAGKLTRSASAPAKGAVAPLGGSVDALVEKAARAAQAEQDQSGGATRSGSIAETLQQVPTCAELLRSQKPVKNAEDGGPTAQWQNMQAGLLVMQRKFDEALRTFCGAIGANPDHAGLRVSYLQLLLQLRDANAAVEQAKQAVKASPKEWRLKNLLGDALAQRGDWEAARQTWLHAARVDASDPDAVLRLAAQQMNGAREALQRRKFQQAKRRFRRAAVLDPRDIEAASGVAQMLLVLEDPKPAVAWARRTVSLEPRASTPRVLLGKALVEAGDLDGAEAAFRDALRFNAGDRDALGRLSQLKRKQLQKK